MGRIWGKGAVGRRGKGEMMGPQMEEETYHMNNFQCMLMKGKILETKEGCRLINLQSKTKNC